MQVAAIQRSLRESYPELLASLGDSSSQWKASLECTKLETYVTMEETMDIRVEGILRSKGYDIWSVKPAATVFEALELMAEKNIGAVLVIDGKHLAGIFSERDYARKVVLDGRSSRDSIVNDLMTSELVTVDTHTSIQTCLELITENRIRHLPVVENGEVLGMLTVGDVVKHIIQHLEVTVRDLESYISGDYGS